MTWQKRLFDLFFAAILVIVLLPIIAGLSVWIWIRQGRPVFFVSERMKTPTKPFKLWKFRTMSSVSSDAGVSGGYKSARLTEIGKRLRARRLDELPQLWNILRGDMSFVGPRPPLRQYVEAYPEIYAQVLKSRPGVTGLATLVYNEREATLLAHCSTAEETDETYRRFCIPRKAHLDLIYQKQQSMCYDFVLVFETIGGVFGGRSSKTTQINHDKR